MISKYNLHSSDIRPISDDALHSEKIVNCNGPSIDEAYSGGHRTLRVVYLRGKQTPTCAQM